MSEDREGIARFPARLSDLTRAGPGDPEPRRFPIYRTGFPLPFRHSISLPARGEHEANRIPEFDRTGHLAVAGGRRRGAGGGPPPFIHNRPPHRFSSTKGLPPQTKRRQTMPGPGQYRNQQIKKSLRKKRVEPKFPEVGDLQIGSQPSNYSPMNPAGLNNLNLVPSRPKRKRRRR